MNQRDLSSATDEDIICRVIDGDVNAFEFLMKRYQPHVLKIVKKHIPHRQIEEIAQDVFVRVYQSLPTFSKQNSFRQWLSVIAVRTCYDFWRKHYRSREIPMTEFENDYKDVVNQIISDQSGLIFQEHADRQKVRELLDWALDKLSPEDRMVLELVYLEGLSGAEAAALLGWSIANVKVRSFRSRKTLHKLLLNHGRGK